MMGGLDRNQQSDMLLDQNPLYSGIFGISNEQFVCEQIERWEFTSYKRTFKCVLLDPPWYLKTYIAWINAALSFIVPGGSLLLPIFPRLIRESAESEIQSLVNFLQSLGSVSFLPFRARYETPSFEAACFRAVELPALHGWRSASIAAVRVDDGAGLSRPTLGASSHSDWTRYRFGSAVVAAETLPALPAQKSKASKSFFLDSVSDRDGRRHDITAISSRNIATRMRPNSPIKDQLRILEEHGNSTLYLDPLIEALSRLEHQDG
jgi:hypothetical protein